MKEKRTDKNENENSIKARRRIIKAIAGTSGAVVAGKSLPENWTRPAIDMALLPVHAQTSGIVDVCTEMCNLNVEFQWTNTSSIDLDLELLTPGGNRIAPKAINGVIQGNCLQHNGDDLGSPAGTHSETISNIGSGVSPGHYAVYLRNNGTFGWGGSVTVSGCLDRSLNTGVTAGGEVRVLSFDIPEVP